MRKLGWLYTLCAATAAVCLGAIAALVLAQIAARALGIKVAGLDDFAAWSMAASAFLALPQALVKGDHIRVSILLDLLPPAFARAVDLCADLVGTALSLWAAWSVCMFVRTSYQLHDVSQGELAMPMWLPQSAMSIGFALLAIAFVEGLVHRLVGRPLAMQSAGELHHAE